jgi:hypothetical protein
MIPTTGSAVFIHSWRAGVAAAAIALALSAGSACAAGPSAAPEDPCFPTGTERPPRLKGEPFASLEAYLDYRRRLGATDHPYYAEVRPGLYRCVVWPRRAGAPEPPPFTREELARRYGFSR